MKEFFKRNALYIILIFIIGILTFYIIQLNNKLDTIQAQQTVDQQNYIAHTDSIYRMFNIKLQEWEFSQSSMIGRLEDIKEYDIELYNKLIKMNGNILAAVNSSVNIIVDEIQKKNTIISQTDDSTFVSEGLYEIEDEGFKQSLLVRDNLRINYDYVKTNINGKDTTIFRPKVSSLGMEFGPNNLSLDLTFGFTEEKNRYKVWATSPSKYVDISELSGYYQYFPKDVRHWVVGPSIGYGIIYDSKNNVMRPGWYAGFSATYKLWDLPKVKIFRN